MGYCITEREGGRDREIKRGREREEDIAEGCLSSSVASLSSSGESEVKLTLCSLITNVIFTSL